MKYDYQVSSHRRQKFLRRFYIFVISVFVFSALAAAGIKLDNYLSNRRNTPQSTTTEKTTEYIAPSTKIFRTQYFQFQSNNSWNEIPTESTATKFVYRGLKGSLIEQELNIYVNTVPANLSSTRVLPVDIKGGSQLAPATISEPCVKALPGGSSSRDTEVSFQNVTVNCDSDGTQYEVLVGLKGGTTKITLVRPDQTNAVYTIFYRNVKAIPDPTELYEIIGSFQTR